MVVNSLLADDAILSEREVVLEEISRHEDTPDDAVHDLFTSALMADHPLGLPVLGTPQTVGWFDHAASATFKDRMYVSGNTVVAVAGHVDHAVSSRQLTGILRSPRERDSAATRGSPSPSAALRSSPRTRSRRTSAGESPRWMPAPNERFTLAILDSILGGGMGVSPVPGDPREAGYGVRRLLISQSVLRHGSVHGVCGTRPSNAEEVVKLIRAQADALAADGVTTEELTRAKESFKGQLVLSLESTRNRMTRLGKSEVTQSELLSTDELVARVDAVTADDVHVLAARLFSQPQVLTMIAPFSRDDMSDLLD